MNVNIAEKNIKEFAQEIFIWAVENGLFLKLKDKMLRIDSRSKDLKRIVDLKIEEIGSNPLLVVFSEEAFGEQLKSGVNDRFFTENILLKDYFEEEDYNFFYLSNQWTENSTFLNLNKFIELINNELKPNYFCGYTVLNKPNKKYVFYVIKTSSKSEIKENAILNIQSSANDLLYKKEEKCFSYNELVNKFLFRLRTQDRPYSNRTEFAFHTSIFYKLDKEFFENWCKDQIKNLKIYSKTGASNSLESVAEIKFDNSGIYYKLSNDNKYSELYFKYQNVLLAQKDYVNQIKFLTIDHIDSIDSILLKHAKDLPTLKNISKITFKKFGVRQKLNIIEVNSIIAGLTEDDKKNVLKELKVVGSFVNLQLLPDQLNKSKGNL